MRLILEGESNVFGFLMQFTHILINHRLQFL